MPSHSYIKTLMEEAGLEVGVEIGSPNIAAMLCLFPKVLERGEWQGREAQGVLIVAGASERGTPAQHLHNMQRPWLRGRAALRPAV